MTDMALPLIDRSKRNGKSNTNTFRRISLLALSSCLAIACGKADEKPADPAPVGQTNSDASTTPKSNDANKQATFTWIKNNILSQRCMDCHSATNGDGDGLDSANFDSYEGVIKVVTPLHPESSKLYVAVLNKKMPKGMDPMPGMPNPPPPTPLTENELKAISDWILAGAPNN